MNKKLSKLLKRFHEVEQALGTPEVFGDQKRYRELTQEHAYLSSIARVAGELDRCQKELKDNRELLEAETDTEFLKVLKEDCARLEERSTKLDAELENLLVPPDPHDNRTSILELRAGAGGDEAALFVGDCVRMYRMFADRMGWKVEQLSASPSELGGYRDYVMVVSGANVYRYLRHEGGTHRVQRVPDTEAQGRVHTSTITVAVLMEPEEGEEVKIEERDLRIDTYRSSGAGGQHVNTTDSAVRVTHLPTGLVVYCQEERSQHKNKAKCMRLLQAKLLEVEEQKKNAEIASSRSSQVGTGDRSERIRTYNFPQNRLTDHRINKTSHNLTGVMEGDLEEIVLALVADAHHRRLHGTDDPADES